MDKAVIEIEQDESGVQVSVINPSLDLSSEIIEPRHVDYLAEAILYASENLIKMSTDELKQFNLKYILSK